VYLERQFDIVLAARLQTWDVALAVAAAIERLSQHRRAVASARVLFGMWEVPPQLWGTVFLVCPMEEVDCLPAGQMLLYFHRTS
jgi:hypothetical protein